MPVYSKLVGCPPALAPHQRAHLARLSTFGDGDLLLITAYTRLMNHSIDLAEKLRELDLRCLRHWRRLKRPRCLSDLLAGPTLRHDVGLVAEMRQLRDDLKTGNWTGHGGSASEYGPVENDLAQCHQAMDALIGMLQHTSALTLYDLNLYADIFIRMRQEVSQPMFIRLIDD